MKSQICRFKKENKSAHADKGTRSPCPHMYELCRSVGTCEPLLNNRSYNCHSLNSTSTQVESDKLIAKTTHPPTDPHHHTTYLNFLGTSRQRRKLIFGMQPYFDQTKKTTSEKKWKTTSKKIKNGRRPKKK